LALSSCCCLTTLFDSLLSSLLPFTPSATATTTSGSTTTATTFKDDNGIDCTSASLFADPLKIAECIRPDHEASSCDNAGEASRDWDSWVRPRYKSYTKDECITPEVVSNKGTNFAISGGDPQ